MSLRERIQEDTTAAMRSGDALRRDVLRMVQNTAYNLEKAKKTTLTDDELLAVTATPELVLVSEGQQVATVAVAARTSRLGVEIGRASCRERV